MQRAAAACSQRHFPLRRGRRCGIFGHSMGGHGALTLALRHPGLFRSVSAFAPICAPVAKCPWGQKAFTRLPRRRPRRVGTRTMRVQLMAARRARCRALLVDQGLADKFLAEQLQPERLEAACAAAGQPLTLRRHAGYDHGYYFIATFVADHLAHHARTLRAGA